MTAVPVVMKKSRRRQGGIAADALLALAALCAAVPVAWLLYSSFRLSRYIIGADPLSSGLSLTFSNYTSIFSGTSELGRQLINSVIIVVGAIVVCLAVGGLAGYSLSKLGWSKRASTAVLGAAVLIQLMPPITLLPGLYVTLQHLGIYGSLGSLVLLNAVFNVPFATILMKVYFDAVPSELREAAAVDGASEARILWRLMVPLAAPGLATTSILVGIFSWNEFLMGLTLVSTTANSPVTVGLATLLQPYSVQFGPLAAAASVVAIPIIVISVLGGRYIVSGLTRGALK